MSALQEMMKEELAKQDRANKEASEKLEARLHIVENENTELKERIKGLTAALTTLTEATSSICIRSSILSKARLKCFS